MHMVKLWTGRKIYFAYGEVVDRERRYILHMVKLWTGRKIYFAYGEVADRERRYIWHHSEVVD